MTTTLTAGLDSEEFETGGVQVLGLRGWERISALFWFELELVMRDGLPLPEGAAPGARVTLTLRQTGDAADVVRHVHGIFESVCDRFDEHLQHRTYVTRIVPEIARLRLVETQEIFLAQDVPAVITAKLALHDLADARVALQLSGTYPARELIVQYRESDLSFISRLAEHLGVSYLFEHGEEGREKLVFTDDVVNAGLTSPLEEVAYHREGERLGVYGLQLVRRLLTSTHYVQDYNYRTPLADISTKHELKVGGVPLGNGGGIIEYGTHHKDIDEGARLAQIRAEEHLSRHEVYTGKTVELQFTAGLTTTVTGHPHLGDIPLLVVEVEHDAQFAVEGLASATNAAYEGKFKAISSTIRYRPPRETPRPRIHGLLTGTVALGTAAAAGGPAQIDSEGRYTVQLHFDTVVHEGDQKASHPIRMAQPFAGTSHGFHFPLRPGAEVVLAFLDGDPDRPIIVGSVPNAAARSTTTSANASQNRIATTAGVLLEINDGK